MLLCVFEETRSRIQRKEIVCVFFLNQVLFNLTRFFLYFTFGILLAGLFWSDDENDNYNFGSGWREE